MCECQGAGAHLGIRPGQGPLQVPQEGVGTSGLVALCSSHDIPGNGGTTDLCTETHWDGFLSIKVPGGCAAPLCPFIACTAPCLPAAGVQHTLKVQEGREPPRPPDPPLSPPLTPCALHTLSPPGSHCTLLQAHPSPHGSPSICGCPHV